VAIAIIFILLCVIYRNALKFYVKEFIGIYSVNETFFSKKRIESGIAFLFALGVTMYYVYKKIDTLDIFSFGYIMTTWLFIAGYVVNQIQKEKKDDKVSPPAEGAK
jgi:hypothetical protein